MIGIELQQLVHIPADSVTLEGELIIPRDARAIVAFAHGSGSSRHSTRNKYVAKVIQDAGIGTLLFDLLTRQEDTVYENRFDINLLTNRLKAATVWLSGQPQTERLKIGYFGASTGAAAALRAAAGLGTEIGAIVSRGGRPDMAEDALAQVQSPTLLIVGGHDEIVIQLNQQAYRVIRAEKELRIIPGATHLFEEPGALEEVARLATDWFKRYLLISA
jgi:dienelactone hydrolase